MRSKVNRSYQICIYGEVRNDDADNHDDGDDVVDDVLGDDGGDGDETVNR